MRFIRACSFSERIGEEGVELIFRESIRINGPDSEDPDVYTETTVQEKNIAFPTDAKLHRKIIKQCEKISAREDLKVRQNYRRTIKKLAVDLRFRNHPKNKGKARKSDKKLKTIAGRLVREIERQLPSNVLHWNAIGIFNRVLSQTRTDKIKFTRYINLREHKKYEFGNKVSITRTGTGVIVGAKSFRNEYDGHTLEPVLQQVSDLVGQSPKTNT